MFCSIRTVGIIRSQLAVVALAKRCDREGKEEGRVLLKKLQSTRTGSPSRSKRDLTTLSSPPVTFYGPATLHKHSELCDKRSTYLGEMEL